MGFVMQKAVGWASALVVAVSILVIAFRAGTQTSPYMPARRGSGRSSNQSPYASIPSDASPAAANSDQMNSKEKLGDNGAGSRNRNRDGRSPAPSCKIKILSVIPTPLLETSTPDGRHFQEATQTPSCTETDTAPGIKPEPNKASSFRPSKAVPGETGKPRSAAVEAGFKSDSIPAIARPSLREGKGLLPTGSNPPGRATSNQPTKSPSPKVVKPRIQYPDAVSPYHPDASPSESITPLSLSQLDKGKAAGPKPLFDEVIWRVIENPANKRQGLTSAAAQYFNNAAKAEENRSGEMPDHAAEAELVKLETTSPRPEPVPEVAKEVQLSKEVNPPPIEATPQAGEPVGRLPEVLPETRPTSLIDSKPESQIQELAAANRKIPTDIPTTPAPGHDQKANSRAIVQAKYESSSKEMNPPAVSYKLPELIMPAREAQNAPPPKAQTSDASDLKTPVNAVPIPTVIVPKEEPPADALPQRMTLTPPVSQKPCPESRKPKLAKVISLQAKSPAFPPSVGDDASGLAETKASTCKPPSESPRLPPISEPGKAMDARPSLPVIINHSHPKVFPMVSIQEAKKKEAKQKERIINVPKEAPPSPRKLPPTATDSPLVLGPARELLEDSAMKAVGPKASEAQASDSIVSIRAPEKAASAQPKTQPYLEKWLKDYIQGACEELVDDLEITLGPSNRLQVHFRVKNEADVEKVGRKILDLPELSPYQVSLDIKAMSKLPVLPN
jgi:hypothetical protein